MEGRLDGRSASCVFLKPKIVNASITESQTSAIAFDTLTSGPGLIDFKELIRTVYVETGHCSLELTGKDHTFCVMGVPYWFDGQHTHCLVGKDEHVRTAQAKRSLLRRA